MSAMSPALSKLLEQCKTFDGHDGYNRTVPEGLSETLQQVRRDLLVLELTAVVGVVLYCVSEGELSESEAAKLLRMDVVGVRRCGQRAKELMQDAWKQYRAENPPRVTNINQQGQPLTQENLAEIESLLREHGTPINDAEFIADMRRARAEYMTERGLSEEEMIARENAVAAEIAGVEEIYDAVRQEDPQQSEKHVTLTDAEKRVLLAIHRSGDNLFHSNNLQTGMDKKLQDDALYCLAHQTPYLEVTPADSNVYWLTEQGQSLVKSWEPQ